MNTHPQKKTPTAGRKVRFLSFLVPAMNEEQTIEPLYEGIREQARALAKRWEIIFIDDGSTDATWSVMSGLAKRDPEHVRALRFRHNRGKADALALGYREARGHIVFTMDADLQDDPQEIPRFIEKLEEGYGIVSGWKRKRFDPWHKVLPSRVFNAVLSRLVGVKLHDHNCGFKAYRREVVKALPMYGDMHRMVPSLASFHGYRTAEIEVQHHARQFGVSKYGWSRLMIGALDMTTVSFLQRFRDCPMHFAGKLAAVLMALGIFCSVASGVLAVLGFASGWLAVVGAMALGTGVIVVMQGLLSEQRVHRDMNIIERPLPVAEELGGTLELVPYEEPAAVPATTNGIEQEMAYAI
ncbi:MAG: glycosyltransferase family 2 protein [Akkermansiaceae bacterium]|nr:glycosyltransferase family 2 protein [Akkermansiaceae bacterium]NNM29802.1 glycosyltransferase family 2 protein [Akkermansiaceae bacterium]